MIKTITGVVLAAALAMSIAPASATMMHHMKTVKVVKVVKIKKVYVCHVTKHHKCPMVMMHHMKMHHMTMHKM